MWEAYDNEMENRDKEKLTDYESTFEDAISSTSKDTTPSNANTKFDDIDPSQSTSIIVISNDLWDKYARKQLK